MSYFTKLSITFLLLTTLLARQLRQLQAVYDVIIIGAGAAGVGASVALTQKNVNHIIIEARNRFGGRTVDATVNGVKVDLGAMFVQNPGTNNSIDTFVKKLNWGTRLANMSALETMIPKTDQAIPTNITKDFTIYVKNQVNNGKDMDLSTAWQNFKVAQSSKGYSATVLNRSRFDIFLWAHQNGADLDTYSAIRYSQQHNNPNNPAYDYLPQTSYAALIQEIYRNYTKNASIIYNQVVTNIDYSGQMVKITTKGGSVYNAKRVINTIPLGVLQNGSVTFTPTLPQAYQTAISSIGMGIVNKVIVNLGDTFWPNPDTTRKVNLVTPGDQTNKFFPQFYVLPSSPRLLIFFVAGNSSKNMNKGNNDSEIIFHLKTAILNKYYSSDSYFSISNYSITRWQEDPYAQGSYSYYKKGTTAAHFKTLMTNISNKLWFAGEHVHDTQSSYVHGAFQSGQRAGQSAGQGLGQSGKSEGKTSWQMWRVVSIVCMALLLLI